MRSISVIASISLLASIVFTLHANSQPVDTGSPLQDGVVSNEELKESYNKIIKIWADPNGSLNLDVDPRSVLDQVSQSDNAVDMGRMVLNASPFSSVLPNQDFAIDYLVMLNAVSVNISIQAVDILTYETPDQQKIVILDAISNPKKQESNPSFFGDIDSAEAEARRLRHELVEYNTARSVQDEINKQLVQGLLREFESLDVDERQQVAERVKLQNNDKAVELLQEQGVQIHSTSPNLP